MQDQLREAILEELRRQADARQLAVERAEDPSIIVVKGRLDIDALVMVIEGTVAGGP